MMEESRVFNQIEVPDIIIEKWQGIINIMAKIIDVPAALIMKIIGSDISVCVSSETDNNPYHPGDKEHLHNSGLYCETVIKTKNMLIIPNALADEAWKNNPDVKLNMISYLGFPVTFPDGTVFGTICVLDNKENSYSQTYIELVQNFHIIVEKDLELLYMNHVLGTENQRLCDYISEIQTLRGIIPICASCKKIRDDEGYWNRLEAYIEKHSDAKFSHGLCDDCIEKLYGDQEWYHLIETINEKDNGKK